MDQFFIRFPDFKKKAVTLSYDDGVIQDRQVVRLLNEHGMKGSFNLNSSSLLDPDTVTGSRPRLTAEEAILLYDGHEIAVHSLTHPFLTQLPANRATWEVLKDRQNLETLFHRIVRGMAYPMGHFDDALVRILENCGIVYARTTVSSRGFDLPSDWLRLQPTCHHDDPELPSLCEQFLALDYPYDSKLFCLWGHGYEFDENDNWDVLERFLDRMGGRNDIWYATGIDICEYMRTAGSLQLSADGRIVFNPSATEVFLEYHGKEIVIRPAETLYLP